MGAQDTVHLLATGGTIANPLDIDGYLPGQDLVDEVPELDSVADVRVTDVSSTGSSGITPEIWFDLHRTVSDAVDSSPPDGFVVTHGSNTVEETAYFLNLTLDTEVPVVLTAAQRNHRLIGNDGDRNLLDAVKVARAPEAVGRGVLVVLNDEIHHARDVTKTASGRPDAWTSGNLGVVGLIDKRDNMKFYRRTERLHTTDSPFDVTDVEPAALPDVEIVYSAAGNDGTMVECAVESGADGIVIAALPTGSPAAPVDRDGQLDAAERAARSGTPVVLSHRGLDGWPYPTDPFIWGDTLTPQKARVLLSLALLETTDHDEIERYFMTL